MMKKENVKMDKVRMMDWKKILKKSWKVTKWVLIACLIFFIYLFVTAALPFMIMTPSEVDTNVVPDSVESDERVALMEFGPDAWQARINMIEAAEETLDISYFYMEDGSSVPLFYAHVVEAADRGVQVRYLMDGIFHGMRGDDRAVIFLFKEHPNIELKFYEPIDLLRPWTLNNRMHDKFIIVDGKYAKTGGRNIGDRYYIRESYEEEYSYDRDVMILNPEADELSGTIIDQIKEYYDALWSSEYSVSQTDDELSEGEREDANEYREEIMEWLEKSNELSKVRGHDYDMEDWWERAHEIESGYLVHNSIKRGQKEPLIWQDMLRLVQNAKEHILIQSPWMIPDRHMRRDIEAVKNDFSFQEGMLLTNSRSSNHNPGAQSGTENHRVRFVESDFDLYEYQPPESSLHTKTLIIDRETVAVGAYNFDARSSYLSTENMVVLESPGLAEEILEIVEERYMPHSPQIDKNGNEIDDGEVVIRDEPFWKRIWVPVLRPITWLFESLM